MKIKDGHLLAAKNLATFAAIWLGLWASCVSVNASGVDLLALYPTTLSAGLTNADQALPWDFAAADIFQLSGFSFQVGQGFKVETGPADVGIGHSTNGAVWAVIIPRSGGRLTSQVTNQPEPVLTIWLRFHPSTIDTLFPPDTVSSNGDQDLATEMSVIANFKLQNSWHAGNNVLIPPLNQMTVDVDTLAGPRRFFAVDTAAGTATYYSWFEGHSVPVPPAITPDLAASAFDQLWQAFDQTYAMFVIRPEVDWTALRTQYRPQALASQSTWQFAGICADMLKPLRDLHVWLMVGNAYVPVFNRPRPSNANPSAYSSLLGGLNDAGPEIQWAITPDKIGFIVIYSWTDDSESAAFDQALDQMRDTRGLILDVRLNGGGSEPLAQQVAGRFLTNSFIYAYDQIRTGTNHTDLSEKRPRTVAPDGPWRYDRPVIVLIGQKAMSSNESFIAMMTGDPQAVTMGDHTAGSSGNPKIVQLPLDMTVSVPQWIDYLPDGTLLDEHGITPDIPFTAAPEAFEGARDALLSPALERLKSVPLPPVPIPGPDIVVAGQWPGYVRGEPLGIALSGNYAYVAAGALQVIDISNPAQPRRVSACGASDAQGVAVAGHYAYVADEFAGLLVIDVSDPAQPQHVATLQTQGWLAGIAVSGNYAYLAEEGPHALEVVDTSSPLEPSIVGHYDGSAGCVVVSGNYAYLGAWSGTNTELDVVDVTNPRQPQRVGRLETKAGVSSLAAAGKYVYAAASGVALTVDVSEPADPHVIGVFSNAGTYIQAVALSGQYLLTGDDDGGLQVVDVNNPGDPSLVGQAATGDRASAVAVSGTNAIVGSDGSGVEAFTLADPTAPRRIGYCQVYGFAQEVAVGGDYACIADGEGGMQVVEIADAAHPQWLAQFDPDGRADVRSVAVTGTYACFTDFSTGLYVIDLAAQGGPKEVGFVSLHSASEVAAYGRYAYALASGSDLHVIDLSHPANPTQRLAAKLPLEPIKLAASSNRLCAAVSQRGLWVFDTTRPGATVPLGVLSTNWFSVNGVAISGDSVYVADRSSGLQIIDISDPVHPRWVGQFTRTYNHVILDVDGVAVCGPTAYVADAGQLDILSVTNPAASVRLSSVYDVPGEAVAVSSNKILVAEGRQGLGILEQIPPAPVLGGSPRFDSAGWHFSVFGQAGREIRLQRSTDLRAWTDWKTVTATGTWQDVLDQAAALQQSQFYRAVVAP